MCVSDNKKIIKKKRKGKQKGKLIKDMKIEIIIKSIRLRHKNIAFFKEILAFSN